jgi:hypothetical protein
MLRTSTSAFDHVPSRPAISSLVVRRHDMLTAPSLILYEDKDPYPSHGEIRGYMLLFKVTRAVTLFFNTAL